MELRVSGFKDSQYRENLVNKIEKLRKNVSARDTSLSKFMQQNGVDAISEIEVKVDSKLPKD